MLGYILLSILLFIAFYAYTRDDRQFRSTASAIQQIWSGSCRLRCRESKKTLTPDSKSDDATISEQDAATSSHSPAPSSCVCESCPCALVENFIETCSPAAKTYAFITGVIFQAYYEFIEACMDLYDRALVVLQTQENGQSTGQADSNKVKIRRLTLTKLDLSARKDDDKSTGAEPGTSAAAPGAGGRDNGEPRTKVEFDPKTRDLAGSDCPSCAEKGLTCIGRCPAERHKKE
ncbi:uncharacterized protein [Battus philenor]|uniref:uncharacterized protein n=1 Tax=Battus philenor TaxID=42288 RepID=UPI0035CED05A